MAFPNIGERVRLVDSEWSSGMEDMFGEVAEIEVTYTINWDDGTSDTVSPDQIEVIRPDED